MTSGRFQNPASYGVGLALAGALLLTPDALLMRISGMSAFQMLGWRGLCLGLIFVIIWALTSAARRRDLMTLGSSTALIVVASQVMNTTLFPVGIAIAPVAPVLLGVATVPVWSALLAQWLYAEKATRATWVAIALVMMGLALAISDKGEAALDAYALAGAACGLGVAFALAMIFVTLRHNPGLPLLLVIGLGSLISGISGWLITGPAQMADGTLWAALISAVIILPLSFFALNEASRHTTAANVSLLLLLETVLAPFWVWLGTGEAASPRMLIGGAIVIVTLAAYVLRGRRRAVLAAGKD
ncbi:DMT family transporter [Yoonia vestfoldensis]|jgi:drug/metabolite transporter (DMT)-like permease|uniref:EamA-like transporter family protein n=1 Tax=Yoonia vestfoldensis TaxID=245188 RepID=A0A1Y0E966_9RHOB|nr:DMT family transporter [Yoonia vestfoldensis]ARU00154.1 EamA-like transporter family protein [Yoonia vestfoldensis]